MQWHDFVFSGERKPKILRHLCFWAAWWLYFLFCHWLLQQPIPFKLKPFYLTPGNHLAIKTILLVFLYSMACYFLMYYLFPLFTKGRWIKAIACLLLVCTLLFFASHILYWNVFSFIDSFFGSTRANKAVSRFWPAINLGLINFLKVGTAAIIIKYVKYWWQKQKESERLEREKVNAELQLLKAQVHPDFLFSTLNSIYIHALSSSPRTSGMLLKLSDLLSYMLYECDRRVVPLEREIEMMKEYIQLERIKYNNSPEMEVNIKGDLTGKVIAPFLLLPFIENSFNYDVGIPEQFWINMDIRVEKDFFSMKLTNGISEDKANQMLPDTNRLNNVRKRLTLLYPGQHELRMSTEQEMLIVILSIRLNEDAGMIVNGTDVAMTRGKKETITAF